MSKQILKQVFNSIKIIKIIRQHQKINLMMNKFDTLLLNFIKEYQKMQQDSQQQYYQLPTPQLSQQNSPLTSPFDKNLQNYLQQYQQQTQQIPIKIYQFLPDDYFVNPSRPKRQPNFRKQRTIQKNVYRDIYRKLIKCQLFHNIAIPMRYFQISQKKFNNSPNSYLTYLILWIKRIFQFKYPTLQQYSTFFRNLQNIFIQQQKKISYTQLICFKLQQLAKIVQQFTTVDTADILSFFKRIKQAGSTYYAKQSLKQLQRFKQFQQSFINTIGCKSNDELKQLLKKRQPSKNKKPQITPPIQSPTILPSSPQSMFQSEQLHQIKNTHNVSFL